MIVLLNGAFGIGKTTVAWLLQRRLPGSVIVDPELGGSALRLISAVLPLQGRRTDDYQDMPAWRRLTIASIRTARLFRSTIIAPMAFTNPDYLREVLDGVRRFDADVRQFCLVAPLEVVEDRLRRRAAASSTPVTAWQTRRAAECCAAHAGPGFGEPVPAGDRDPDAIAADIVARLQRPL